MSNTTSDAAVARADGYKAAVQKMRGVAWSAFDITLAENKGDVDAAVCELVDAVRLATARECAEIAMAVAGEWHGKPVAAEIRRRFGLEGR